MLSVVYAAVALPMLPVQLLVQNVCYDLVQLTLPVDSADPEQLRRPQRWSSRDLLIFVACFAPLSSVFGSGAARSCLAPDRMVRMVRSTARIEAY